MIPKRHNRTNWNVYTEQEEIAIVKKCIRRCRRGRKGSTNELVLELGIPFGQLSFLLRKYQHIQ